MSENNQPKTLAAKMAAIMGDLDPLEKEGRNRHFNYDYVTDTTVFNAVRELLAKYRVALLSSMIEARQEVIEGKNGWQRTVAVFEFTLVCGDTEKEYKGRWQSEATDNQDKGINKAATAALKNWLLKTFCMASGDDVSGAQPTDKKRSTAHQQPGSNGPANTTPGADPRKHLDTGMSDRKSWGGDGGLIMALKEAADMDGPTVMGRLSKMAAADLITLSTPQTDVYDAFMAYEGA